MVNKKIKKAIVPLSKRERKRYVLIEILNEKVAEKDFYFGFWIEILSFFGLVGLAKLNARIVLFLDNKVIIKCKRGKEVDLIAGISFIKKIRNKKIILNPLLTSGSINALKTSKFFEGTNILKIKKTESIEFEKDEKDNITFENVVEKSNKSMDKNKE